jgi:adenosylhomocysteine nucleosidase
MSRLLVIAATRREAAYVPAHLPLVVTGVGKTAAATATSRALAALDDRSGLTVVNIGSAGALRDGLSGLHEIDVVVNHDLDAAVIRAFGEDPQERLVLRPDQHDPMILATGDVFVTEAAVRIRLARHAHLVDMEGYAVAFAATAFGVSVRLVKHVSDQADEGAHDWASLVDHSARALGQWLAGH